MPDRTDEFYVGYLPIPPGHLRFIRIAVPTLLWLMVLAASAVALFQRAPGDSHWDQGKPIERTGVLHEKPYPCLLSDNSAVFLVEQGKRGAQARARGLDGKRVRVRGWKLDRDGREILELIPEANAIEPVPDTTIVTPRRRVIGQATLRGEIVDYKCYLGAMKPGDGKAHKACAILCMTGGIPAMLVSHEPGGPRYTVLVDAQGEPVGKDTIEFAGEPVEVSGQLVEQGPLRLLQLTSIRRR